MRAPWSRSPIGSGSHTSHDAKNDAEKGRLFDAARSGQVAVLIRSTGEMGVGTKVQDRITAMHLVDCPWRPSDLEQRDGRSIRQGNQNTRWRSTGTSSSAASMSTPTRSPFALRQPCPAARLDRGVVVSDRVPHARAFGRKELRCLPWRARIAPTHV